MSKRTDIPWGQLDPLFPTHTNARIIAYAREKLGVTVDNSSIRWRRASLGLQRPTVPARQATTRELGLRLLSEGRSVSEVLAEITARAEEDDSLIGVTRSAVAGWARGLGASGQRGAPSGQRSEEGSEHVLPLSDADVEQRVKELEAELGYAGIFAAFSKLSDDLHAQSAASGFWDKRSPAQRRNDPGTFSTKLLLAITELAEAVEADRTGLDASLIYTPGGVLDGRPEGQAVEIADALIRLIEAARGMGIPVVQALLLKLAYNKTRPFRHGGKRY